MNLAEMFPPIRMAENHFGFSAILIFKMWEIQELLF